MLLDKQFSGAGSHASIQLTTLLTSITENPARYYADTHCHTHLWREEGRKQNCVKQSDGMIDLTLKSKSCTPSVYVSVVECTRVSLHFTLCVCVCVCVQFLPESGRQIGCVDRRCISLHAVTTPHIYCTSSLPLQFEGEWVEVLWVARLHVAIPSTYLHPCSRARGVYFSVNVISITCCPGPADLVGLLSTLLLIFIMV